MRAMPFDMLPEEFLSRKIVKTYFTLDSYSAVDLPCYLTQNADKFRYYLPGSGLCHLG